MFTLFSISQISTLISNRRFSPKKEKKKIKKKTRESQNWKSFIRKMRVQPERISSTNTMSPSRRPLHINIPPSSSSSSAMFQRIRPSLVTSFLQKPLSLPFVLSIFLFLAWISLRSYRTSHSLHLSNPNDDVKANLRRFSSHFPSPITKDNRGWILDPIAVAASSSLSGTSFLFVLLI